MFGSRQGEARRGEAGLGMARQGKENLIWPFRRRRKFRRALGRTNVKYGDVLRKLADKQTMAELATKLCENTGKSLRDIRAREDKADLDFDMTNLPFSPGTNTRIRETLK